MQRKGIILLLGCILFVGALVNAQTVDTIQNSGKHRSELRSYILPGSLIVSGSMLVLTHSPIHSFNVHLSTGIAETFSGFHTKADDWVQYVPGGAALALGFVGIPGAHRTGNKFIRYAFATVMGSTTVHALKKWTHVLRPDGSTFNSFPSGHTATAFTGAEMLHQEYGSRSVWYSVAGYTLASATGVMRMLNNRHSLADVLTGAGIGMASVKCAYWLVDRFSRQKKPLSPISF